MGGSISYWNSTIKVLSSYRAVPSSPIILEVHTLCAHTHSLQQFCHAWNHSWKASFIMVHRLAVALHLISYVTKHSLISSICSLGNSQSHWMQGVGNMVVLAHAWFVFLPRTAALSELPALIHMRNSLHSKPLWWSSDGWHTSVPLKFFQYSQFMVSQYKAHFQGILAHFWNCCTGHTHQFFLKSIIPINSLQVLHCLCSTLPYLAHELHVQVSG